MLRTMLPLAATARLDRQPMPALARSRPIAQMAPDSRMVLEADQPICRLMTGRRGTIANSGTPISACPEKHYMFRR